MQNMLEALELIAAPMRPDGTWNRCREACRQLAQEAIESFNQHQASDDRMARQRLQEAVNDVMRYQWSHCKPAMHALGTLIDEAERFAGTKTVQDRING